MKLNIKPLAKYFLNNMISRLVILKRFMKPLKILTLVASLLFTLSAKSQIIYVTQVQTVADLKVYVTTCSTTADLTVYKAPFQTYPGVNNNVGDWYFTDIQAIADKTIYFTDISTIADLTIYYTQIPTEAGWVNSNKKSLLED